jgi:hypothetical protein
VTGYQKTKVKVNVSDALQKASEDTQKRYMKIHTYGRTDLPQHIKELEETKGAGEATDYQKRQLENLKSLDKLYDNLRGPLGRLRGAVSATQMRITKQAESPMSPELKDNWEEISKYATKVAKELEEHKQKRGAMVYRRVAAVAEACIKETPTAKKTEKKTG